MTKLEYLQSVLPEPFWKAIIQNAIHEDGESHQLASPATIKSMVVTPLFTWRKTPEGHDFWRDVSRSLCGECPLPQPHLSWSIQDAPQPISGHNGLETPNQGQPQTTKAMLHKYADKPVATPTLVNGQDVTDLSDREILNQIKARKKSVEEIVATGATGAYVDHFRTQEGIAVEALLKELNSRTPQAAAVQA